MKVLFTPNFDCYYSVFLHFFLALGKLLRFWKSYLFLVPPQAYNESKKLLDETYGQYFYPKKC
jgi:hypothetical protein